VNIWNLNIWKLNFLEFGIQMVPTKHLNTELFALILKVNIFSLRWTVLSLHIKEKLKWSSLVKHFYQFEIHGKNPFFKWLVPFANRTNFVWFSNDDNSHFESHNLYNSFPPDFRSWIEIRTIWLWDKFSWSEYGTSLVFRYPLYT
jgi:hypothetical protein